MGTVSERNYSKMAEELNNNETTEEKLKLQVQALQDLTLVGAVSKREAWASKTPPPTEEDEIEFLYDSSILSDLPSAKELSAKDKSLYFRPLQSDDYNRGYIELLKQLTSVGDVTELDFKERFRELKSSNETYYHTVIVDSSTDQIVGSATLIKERKFIHKCANRGIIEEVIVSDKYRGKSLGKLIVKCLIELGKFLGCYKITLNCTDNMLRFYKNLEFVAEENNANFLVIRVPQ